MLDAFEGDSVVFNVKGGSVRNTRQQPVKFFVTAAQKHQIKKMDHSSKELVADEEAQVHMDNRFEYFGPFTPIKKNRKDLKDYGELSEQNIADWCLFILDKKDSDPSASEEEQILEHQKSDLTYDQIMEQYRF